uniref:ATP synthase subunit gamma n=1 Tax=Ulva compressa TaxID=63659 RepID=A0A140KFJ4_ULVCO|nr:mitochondrial ATP synthase gamma subunit [Ulva compressa]
MALRRSLVQVAHTLRQATAPEYETVGSRFADGARSAATLASVKSRIKSVQNIKKITSAMKMVAASKMKRAQAQQEQAVGVPKPFLKLFGEETTIPVRKTVNVPVSTDKGMCGGINTNIAKLTNACTVLDAEDAEKETRLMCVGSKGINPMKRLQGHRLDGALTDYTKNKITFATASAVSEEILKTEYDSVRLMYTSFKSAISFKPTIATILSPETLEKSEVIAEKLDQYEIEGPDRAELLHDMGEFQLACMMYYAMNEAATSEHASRMQAMENSTKNSSEMLEKLTLMYNRTRQAKVTTELNEIISGALSLEDSG